MPTPYDPADTAIPWRRSAYPAGAAGAPKRPARLSTMALSPESMARIITLRKGSITNSGRLMANPLRLIRPRGPVARAIGRRQDSPCEKSDRFIGVFAYAWVIRTRERDTIQGQIGDSYPALLP
ncbi:hypothetical protein GCM10023107_68490 [Actinoplanes octamycinicus]|nr:hypothetical protein Aoc01nite_25410 [Actinoplanes octamycinicus]